MVGSGKKLDFWFWVKVAVVGFMLVFLIYPFCTLITRSFFSTKVDGFTFENYIRFFTKKYYYSALGRSIFVSVVTTITTLIVGVPIAYVMSRYNVWGKQFIHIFIIMSLMSPPFIGAYSWIMLFGRSGLVTNMFSQFGIHLPSIYGKLGIILVFTFKLFPYVYLYTSGAMGSIDSSLEEAAENLGSNKLRRLWTITLPVVLPSIAAGAIMVFMTSLADFGTPMLIGEGYMVRVFKEALGVDIPLPLPRLTYREAMNRYGSDKPDTRFGMELYDLTDIVKDCGFSVFSGAAAGGGTVRGITAKGSVKALTRKEIDKLTEFVRGIGAKGLAWIRLTPEGTTSSFAKFMTEDEMQAILTKAGAETGDVVLIVADTMVSHVLSALGALRNEVAKKLDIIPQDTYNLLWITEFPFFEWDEETETFVAMHHPFTAPMDECLDYLETDKANVRAKAYDLVLNGVELSSGSIRITDPTLQNRIFSLLGLSEEEAKAKFGYLLDAFRFGAPPHGGFGIGLDRLIMQMLRCETLRDVVAYPKVQNASEPMTECPAQVDEIQLQELGIALQKAGE